MSNEFDIPPSIENTKTATLIHPKVSARMKGELLVAVSSRGHRWIIDEPEHKGATDLGPTPLESLLGALVGCESVVLKLVSKAIGFSFTDLTIECTGTADMRGARGVKGVRPYFTSVDMVIELETDESEKRLELLRRNVEQRCPVMNLFEGADVEMNVVWKTRTARQGAA
ncbi:OsmC family protein [Marinovum sp.]|uniref:OsmC family protein n=1 Tax=Marinovum sp. TaxID=2024839 RepID=UPI003A9087FD